MRLTNVDAPCEYLSWDSEFFGYRIARVMGHRLSFTQMANIEHWCAQNEIECLYLLADSDHGETTLLAERNAFHLVDLRMTLAIENSALASLPLTGAVSSRGIQIRAARLSDVPSLETIARTAHEDSRFYHDQHFSKDKCSDLYATWIRRSCQGLAEQVFIAEHDDQVVGYITCTHVVGENPHGAIGLVGVAAAERGMGIGQVLVNRSLRWFVEHDCQAVEVVTQGRNVVAQRMYQRCGFMSQSMRLWYHRWFDHDMQG